jgi:hypothetical protein
MKRIFSARHRYTFYSVSFSWFIDGDASRLVRRVPPHLRPTLLCTAPHCHHPRSTVALSPTPPPSRHRSSPSPLPRRPTTSSQGSRRHLDRASSPPRRSDPPHPRRINQSREGPQGAITVIVECVSSLKQGRIVL